MRGRRGRRLTQAAGALRIGGPRLPGEGERRYAPDGRLLRVSEAAPGPRVPIAENVGRVGEAEGMMPSQNSVAGRGLRLDLELPAARTAPAAARAAVRELFESEPPAQETLQALLLLVSEVVSNAVVHAGAPDGSKIGLTVSARAGTVRVEVRDRGAGTRGLRPRSPSVEAEGGLGLYLVEQLAGSWGAQADGGMRVWFELAL